jgi:hypothetical protein
MPKNRLSLGMDLQDAIRDLEDTPDAIESGAKDAVRQLSVLAEGPMKREAPEGAGRDRHMRDTIDTKFRRRGLTANVGARKRTQDGDLLAEIIVEGTDASSYTPSPGLVGFLGKQMEDWADAKLGDPQAAYPVAWDIVRTGHSTLPDDFVDRSLDDWEDQVEDVAGEQVRDALSRLMSGGAG